MDRFSDDRDNLEPSNSGFDPDEAISRYLARKAARRESSEVQEQEDFDEEPEPRDENGARLNSEESPEQHPHQPLHAPFPTHRPTFGRKGL